MSKSKTYEQQQLVTAEVHNESSFHLVNHGRRDLSSTNNFFDNTNDNIRFDKEDPNNNSPVGSVSSKQRIDMMFKTRGSRTNTNGIDSSSCPSVVSADYQPRRFDTNNNNNNNNNNLHCGIGKSSHDRYRSIEAYSAEDDLYDDSYYYDDPLCEAKNDIQLKIEKMFNEITEARTTTNDNDDVGGGLPLKGQFLVKYMGSVSVAGKINSLEGLQAPLSELYFKYRKNKSQQQQQKQQQEAEDETGRPKDNIEVTLNGLQIEYDTGGTKPTFKMYPFSCIAVWVSVKVFCRKQIGGDRNWEYAFLPLVADEAENQKNHRCPFQRLQDDQLEYFKGRNYDDNSPLFVVVFREMDFQTKQLVCQGFVCQSSDEAIALADMLYRVLNSKLRRSQILRTRNQRRRLRYKNGVSRLSSIGETVTDSILGETITESLEHEQQQNLPPNENKKEAAANVVESDEEKSPKFTTKKQLPSPPGPPPRRPPRKQKGKGEPVIKVTSADDNEQEPLLLLSSSADNGISLRHKKKLHRTASTIRSTTAANMSDIGDVLTKIVIPRSRSFLNKDKLSSRYYDRRHHYQLDENDVKNEKPMRPYDSNNVIRTNKEALRSGDKSPLGFMELFDELQTQEGITSLDGILNVIVNADGMSFNNLKPIYKEFLLKLALVLSKDELFDRSRIIMKRQRRRKKREKPRYRIGTRFVVSSVRRFRNIFQSIKQPTIVVRGDNQKKKKTNDGRRYHHKRKKSSSRYHHKCKRNNPGDSTSTDSFFLTRTPYQLAAVSSSSPIVVANADDAGPLEDAAEEEEEERQSRKYHRSEDSTKKANNNNNNNRRHRQRYIVAMKEKDSSVEGINKPSSSSGYVSFSECSYDTESCVCATIDRCYCSLTKNYDDDLKQQQPAVRRRSRCGGGDSDHQYGSTNVRRCNCDQRHGGSSNLSLMEQLKMKGFAASESSLSGAEDTSLKYAKEDDRRHEPKQNGGSKLAKSLQYVEQNDKFRYAKRMDVYKGSGQSSSSGGDIIPITTKRPPIIVHHRLQDYHRNSSNNDDNYLRRDHRSNRRQHQYSSSSLSSVGGDSSNNLNTVDYNMFAVRSPAENYNYYNNNNNNNRHPCQRQMCHCSSFEDKKIFSNSPNIIYAELTHPATKCCSSSSVRKLSTTTTTNTTRLKYTCDECINSKIKSSVKPNEYHRNCKCSSSVIGSNRVSNNNHRDVIISANENDVMLRSSSSRHFSGNCKNSKNFVNSHYTCNNNNKKPSMENYLGYYP